MGCNNILTFENLIQVPSGIAYEIPSGLVSYYVAVNTEKLETYSVLGKYPISDIGNVCPGRKLSGEVELYEIRVSGYLTYGVSVKCLKSSDNFIVSTSYTENQGCISSSSIIPMSTDEINNKLPYIVIGYSSTDPTNKDITVELISIAAEPPQIINNNYVIVVRGSFDIHLK